MGSKKVKAIVVDMDRPPPFEEPKKVQASIKDYAGKLQVDEIIQNTYAPLGTMSMADLQNALGGLPVRNFSAGQLANVSAGETFKMGADYIGPLNTSRGGSQTHACMPGCIIQCSNVYHDANGKEVVSPVEYETLGLLGSNCGISESGRTRGSERDRERPGHRHDRDRCDLGRPDGGGSRRIRRRGFHARLPDGDPPRQ